MYGRACVGVAVPSSSRSLIGDTARLEEADWYSSSAVTDCRDEECCSCGWLTFVSFSRKGSSSPPPLILKIVAGTIDD